MRSLSSTSDPSARCDALVVAGRRCSSQRTGLRAVVEDGLAVDGDLDLAVDAADVAQQHVVGVVVGRRATVGAGAVGLVMPGADQQHVADDDPASAGAPARLQHVRARAGSAGRPERSRRTGRCGSSRRRGRAARRRRSASRRGAGTSTRRCRSGATSATVSQSDRNAYSAIGGNGLPPSCATDASCRISGKAAICGASDSGELLVSIGSMGPGGTMSFTNRQVRRNPRASAARASSQIELARSVAGRRLALRGDASSLDDDVDRRIRNRRHARRGRERCDAVVPRPAEEAAAADGSHTAA